MQQMARKPFMRAQWAMEGLPVKGRENAIFGLETVRPFAPG
jgi:hypothetical protein